MNGDSDTKEREIARPRKNARRAAASAISSRVVFLPEHIAFLGESESRAEAGHPSVSPVLVQALCWSCTPSAWSVLAQSWESAKAYRNDASPITGKVAANSPSWIHAAAPTFGEPFRDSNAEESTLAALISRAPISFSVAAIDKELKCAASSDDLPYRDSVPDCLSGYLEFLKLPGHEACRLVVAAAHAPKQDQRLTEAFKGARERLQETHSLEQMQLRFCEQAQAPLPLELANLVAAAVLRHLNAPSLANPIFAAVRSKWTQAPGRMASLAPRRRR